MNEGQIIAILLGILTVILAVLVTRYFGGRAVIPSVELPVEVFNSLKSIASRKGLTPEQWVAEQVRQNDSEKIPKSTDEQNSIFHDLDYLAGTWTESDAEEFEQAASDFSKIEKRLWR